LLNYPQPFGSRNVTVGQYSGLAAYVQGGDSFNCSQFGWGSFDHVSGSQTFNANNTGNYTVQVRYPTSQAGQNTNGGSTTVQLVWVAANGTEAANNTNLSAEFTRIEAWGG
jgi:hypothetical protein